MSLLLTYLFITIIITLILFLLGQILPTTSPNLQKNSPYECGFDPINSARLPISFRFFLISLLFLLFDLEIVILIPLPSLLIFNLNTNINLWTLIIFLSLLTIGLFYEWVKGGLDWAQ